MNGKGIQYNQNNKNVVNYTKNLSSKVYAFN